MASTIFLFIFIPMISFILLAINLIFAPRNPYMEKKNTFECGYSSFLGQNRTQFSISFFIFALLFLLFDLEILLVYPYLVSAYVNEIYGLAVLLIFLLALTLGFVFELGKKALTFESKQTQTNLTVINSTMINLTITNFMNNPTKTNLINTLPSIAFPKNTQKRTFSSNNILLGLDLHKDRAENSARIERLSGRIESKKNESADAKQHVESFQQGIEYIEKRFTLDTDFKRDTSNHIRCNNMKIDRAYHQKELDNAEANIKSFEIELNREKTTSFLINKNILPNNDLPPLRANIDIFRGLKQPVVQPYHFKIEQYTLPKSEYDISPVFVYGEERSSLCGKSANLPTLEVAQPKASVRDPISVKQIEKWDPKNKEGSKTLPDRFNSISTGEANNTLLDMPLDTVCNNNLMCDVPDDLPALKALIILIKILRSDNYRLTFYMSVFIYLSLMIFYCKNIINSLEQFLYGKQVNNHSKIKVNYLNPTDKLLLTPGFTSDKRFYNKLCLVRNKRYFSSSPIREVDITKGELKSIIEQEIDLEHEKIMKRLDIVESMENEYINGIVNTLPDSELTPEQLTQRHFFMGLDKETSEDKEKLYRGKIEELEDDTGLLITKKEKLEEELEKLCNTLTDNESNDNTLIEVTEYHSEVDEPEAESSKSNNKPSESSNQSTNTSTIDYVREIEDTNMSSFMDDLID